MIIVTATDSGYFHLARDLVCSIRDKPEGRDIALGCLDLGCDADQLAWLAGQGCEIVAPGWDFDFPERDDCPSHFKAMTARPHLRRHFPGHALYLWIDADAWVQDWAALEIYRHAATATAAGAAFTPEIDRAYTYHYDEGKARRWMEGCYAKAFGTEHAARLASFPIINSGVFAMRPDAVLWERWREALGGALMRTRDFFVEQTAMNYAVYNGAPVTLLPSSCNWHCTFGTPKLERATGALLSHLHPPARIGIVHLCGTKAKAPKVDTSDDAGQPCSISLRYRGR